LAPPYKLETDLLVEEIARRKAKRILIQIPDGLKPQAVALSRIIEEKTQAGVFLSSSACYGACDIAIDQAELLHCDLIVHYGHTRFVAVDGPSMIFLEARSQLNLTPVLEKVRHELSGLKKVGIATTIQHLDQLNSVREHINMLGIEVIVTPKGGHSLYDGQIIGCDYTPLKMIADKVDSFLIVGSTFHGLGASIAVDKPVILADPYSNKVANMNETKRKFILRRYAAIDEAKRAKNFAIILGTKPGQHDSGAISLKKRLETQGKNVTIIVADEISPGPLENFKETQVFVNTACPRIALDDAERFTKPILLPREVLVAIGELTWENLLAQGWL